MRTCPLRPSPVAWATAVHSAVTALPVLVEPSERGLALRDQLATVPAAIVRASGLGLDDIADLRRRLLELVRHLDNHVPEATPSR